MSGPDPAEVGDVNRATEQIDEGTLHGPDATVGRAVRTVDIPARRPRQPVAFAGFCGAAPQ